MKTKVIIADDHQLVRKGFLALLQELDFVDVIGEASNGKELIGLLRNGAKPDVILMDYEMPLMNGLEAAQNIQQAFLGPKIIMLTMLQNRELVEQAIASGVQGFLFKNASFRELEDAIRRVAQGENYFSNEVTLTLVRPATGGDALLLGRLSEREIEVLRFVAQGLSSTEIGKQLFISPRTVDTHRNNVMQKLDIQGIAGLTQFALKHKLI